MKDKIKEMAPRIALHMICIGLIGACAHLCAIAMGDAALGMPIAILGGAYGMQPLKKALAKLPGLHE